MCYSDITKNDSEKLKHCFCWYYQFRHPCDHFFYPLKRRTLRGIFGSNAAPFGPRNLGHTVLCGESQRTMATSQGRSQQICLSTLLWLGGRPYHRAPDPGLHYGEQRMVRAELWWLPPLPCVQSIPGPNHSKDRIGFFFAGIEKVSELTETSEWRVLSNISLFSEWYWPIRRGSVRLSIWWNDWLWVSMSWWPHCLNSRFCVQPKKLRVAP